MKVQAVMLDVVQDDNESAPPLPKLLERTLFSKVQSAKFTVATVAPIAPPLPDDRLSEHQTSLMREHTRLHQTLEDALVASRKPLDATEIAEPCETTVPAKAQCVIEIINGVQTGVADEFTISH